MDNFKFNDFTEKSYRELIKLAKKNYTFITFTQYSLPGRNVLWRHDIDFSPHRAYRLALIESEEGVFSTFFVYIHSEHYNLFEKEITLLIKKISEMGHSLGLHFDLNYYRNNDANLEQLENILDKERCIIEDFFKVKIDTFSLHNPTKEDLRLFHLFKLANMINTYSDYFKNNYAYVSDSNGYWRYRRLKDVLTEAKEEKLQILTHPEWWSPVPMSPRDRISRCIDGRAKKQHKRYDEIMKKIGRKNVRYI